MSSTIDRNHLTEGEQAQVRAIIEALGERKAAERLGVSHPTVARSLSGLSLNPGSVALIRQALCAASEVAQ